MDPNEVSLKEYMKREFKHISDAQERLDNKIESHHKEMREKLEPVIEWKSEAQGSIKSLKWVLGIGMGAISIALTVISLYLAFLRMKP